MIRAFKVEVDPNNVQTTAMLQHCGAARWAYNWGLSEIKKALDAGLKIPSAYDLQKQLVKLKGTPELPWAYEVSKCAFTEPLMNLEKAIKNWSDSRKGKRQGVKIQFPKKKKRSKGIGSCRFLGTIKVFSDSIQLPRLGVLRLKRDSYIPLGSYVQATISERAGHWFVSVIAEVESVKPELTDQVIGIDVGIKTLATCSDGTTFENVKPLKSKAKKLARWQKRLSRRAKGGQNRKKAKAMVAKLHKQVSDIREDAQHKATRAIVNKNPAKIVIEDLNVKGMFKNRRLAKALSDAAFGNFARILTYKATEAGIEVIEAGRFFASSKTCACCGWKNVNLTLSDRIFVCGDCGHTMDRDLNAAINLKNTAGYAGIHAQGDRVSPAVTPLAMVADLGKFQQMSML